MTTQEKRELLLRIIDQDWLANQLGNLMSNLPFATGEHAEDEDIQIVQEYKIRNLFETYGKHGDKLEMFITQYAKEHTNIESIEDLYDDETKDIFEKVDKLSEKFKELLKDAKKENMEQVLNEATRLFNTYRAELQQQKSEATATLQAEKGGGEKKL